jgi:hypothetical protein
MIATQHPVVSEELELASCVVIGKQSRIQDGTLVRVLAQPRNKYEGVHLVLGPCLIRRRPACLSEFELVGMRTNPIDVVRTLQTKWNEHVHKTIAEANQIPWTPNVPQSFNVGATRARFFEWTPSHTYKASSSAEIHSNAKGFAVVMTRGAWFHQSKRNVHTAWHLVEWISIA